MKLTILSFTIVSARLIMPDTDAIENSALSRSPRDLIGYNRMHNNAQIHRMKSFQESGARSSTKSISELISYAYLSDEESKRWNNLRLQLAAIRRLKRARMIERLGY